MHSIFEVNFSSEFHLALRLLCDWRTYGTCNMQWSIVCIYVLSNSGRRRCRERIRNRFLEISRSLPSASSLIPRCRLEKVHKITSKFSVGNLSTIGHVDFCLRISHFYIGMLRKILVVRWYVKIKLEYVFMKTLLIVYQYDIIYGYNCIKYDYNIIYKCINYSIIIIQSMKWLKI